MMIELKYCTIEWTNFGCTTRFRDAREASAWPHDSHDYSVIAHRCGYEYDVMAYCREHEFCHSFVEEKLNDRPSPVLWHAAHPPILLGNLSAQEEMSVQAFQRFLRANERPIVSGVKWDELREEALTMLKPAWRIWRG